MKPTDIDYRVQSVNLQHLPILEQYWRFANPKPFTPEQTILLLGLRDDPASGNALGPIGSDGLPENMTVLCYWGGDANESRLFILNQMLRNEAEFISRQTARGFDVMLTRLRVEASPNPTSPDDHEGYIQMSCTMCDENSVPIRVPRGPSLIEYGLAEHALLAYSTSIAPFDVRGEEARGVVTELGDKLPPGIIGMVMFSKPGIASAFKPDGSYAPMVQMAFFPDQSSVQGQIHANALAGEITRRYEELLATLEHSEAAIMYATLEKTWIEGLRVQITQRAHA